MKGFLSMPSSEPKDNGADIYGYIYIYIYSNPPRWAIAIVINGVINAGNGFNEMGNWVISPL